MTTMLLAVLGWCVVSVAVAGLWAAVCSGARRGADLNRPAWQEGSAVLAHLEHVQVPRPRAVPDPHVAAV